MTDSLLTTREVATRLGLTSQTVIALANSGELRGSFFARYWRFRNEDVAAFVQSKQRVGK